MQALEPARQAPNDRIAKDPDQDAQRDEQFHLIVEFLRRRESSYLDPGSITQPNTNGRPNGLIEVFAAPGADGVDETIVGAEKGKFDADQFG